MQNENKGLLLFCVLLLMRNGVLSLLVQHGNLVSDGIIEKEKERLAESLRRK